MKGYEKILLTFIAIIFLYIIYIHTPITKNVIESNFKNAKILVVENNRKPFYFFSLRSIPNDSHYEIFYKNKMIAKVDRTCFECLEHTILDVKWYRDSVRVTYETNYESYDTINTLYKFPKCK